MVFLESTLLFFWYLGGNLVANTVVVLASLLVFCTNTVVLWANTTVFEANSVVFGHKQSCCYCCIVGFVVVVFVV